MRTLKLRFYNTLGELHLQPQSQDGSETGAGVADLLTSAQETLLNSPGATRHFLPERTRVGSDGDRRRSPVGRVACGQPGQLRAYVPVQTDSLSRGRGDWP